MASTDFKVEPSRAAGAAVEHRLRQAWRRERGYVHLRGACHVIVWLIGLIFVDLFLDWLLALPGFARLLLLAANLGILAWVGYRQWWRHLRRYDPSRVALQVERLHPGLQSLLVSYVQLNGDAPRSPHGSPQLIGAMKQQALRVLAPLDFRGVVDFTTLRKLGGLAAGALLLFGVSVLFAGEFYRVLLVRLFNPASTLAYPTRTRIEAITGELAVRQGDPVRLEASIGGEVPQQGFLYVKQGDARWERVALGRGEGPAFVHAMPKANQSFAYYFRVGDARSETFPVTVVPPPRVVAARVHLRYPRYTTRPAETIDSLTLPAVPEGTEVRWELRCDQELAAGRLQFLREGVEPVALEIDEADPHVARLTLRDVAAPTGQATLLRSRKEAETLSYQLQWMERRHGFTFRDGTRYSIEVVPDRAPVVTVLRPRPYSAQDKMLATTMKHLVITFDVSDDYGLGSAWITYRLNDAPEPRRRPVGAFRAGTRAGKEERAEWTIRDSIPDIKEGDVLTCAVEVSDNREGRDGPNRGLSSPIRLHIVSEEEFRRYAEKEKERGDERIKAAAREETEAATKVKTLIPVEEKNR
jgi:hypothetical protein